jgi:hypothetical protein
MLRATLFTAALLLAGAAPAVAGMIDTTPQWNGTAYEYPLGVPNTATYGQTFTASSSLGLSLDSFSFWLKQDTNDPNGPNASHFSAYVMAWDGIAATGPVLYASAARLLSQDRNNFAEYTFNTGGVNLNDGHQYVAFLSVSNYYDGNTLDDMGWILNSSPYTGGSFVFYNNGSDFSALTTNRWDDIGFLGTDAAFQASFSAAPEPAPLTLLGLGVAGIAGFAWRRRR